MPIYSFKLPDIGEGIAEAEIVAWHVQMGDTVEEDEPLCDVMTDKATVEMTAPVSGRVMKVAGKIGYQIAIGSVLAEFEIGDAASVYMAPPLQSLPGVVPSVVEEPAGIPAQPRFSAEEAEPSSGNPDGVSSASLDTVRPNLISERRAAASPAVRARAKALGIDLSEIKSAGGHVRHADLDTFMSYNRVRGYSVSGARRADEQVRVVGLRRRIAENMAASKRAIPHFTYVEEIDVTKLEALRADLNDNRGARTKLTMLPLLIVAICKTVPDFPMINARYDDEAGTVTRFGAVHLGMATQTSAGLMVPVIRDAQDRNIWQLSTEIGRLADAARTNKAKSAELSGSTLTITSLGPLGGVSTTPVINRPEVAIIGPNRIIERPVLRDGVVVPAKLMNLSISCDHRVVDGWDAASFVQALKRLIETPALLFADSG